MFIMIAVILSITSYCSAGGGMGGGYGGGGAGGYGGSSMGLGMGSSGGYGGGNGGYGAQRMMESTGYEHSGGPITAAVHSRHTVEVKPVPTHNQPIEPQVIEVDSSDSPIILHFNSRSSRLLVQQSHTPSGPGEVQQTSSEDEPHRLIHEVTKPVIQEVREIITPYRRIVQEVRPVVEEVHTVVAKGEKRRNDYGNGGLGGGQGGYGMGGNQAGYGGSQMAMGGYGGGSAMSLSMGSSDGGYGSMGSGVLNLGGSGLSMGSSKSYKS